jgi:hypothetical protein
MDEASTQRERADAAEAALAEEKKRRAAATKGGDANASE